METTQHPHADDFFFTREEAATIAKVSVRQIDYLISDGHLKTKKIGRRVRIFASSLNQVVFGAAEIAPRKRSEAA